MRIQTLKSEPEKHQEKFVVPSQQQNLLFIKVGNLTETIKDPRHYVFEEDYDELIAEGDYDSLETEEDDLEKFYSQADVAGIIGPAYALASEGVDLEGVGEVLDEIREVRTDFWFNKLNPEYDETGPTLTG